MHAGNDRNRAELEELKAFRRAIMAGVQKSAKGPHLVIL